MGRGWPYPPEIKAYSSVMIITVQSFPGKSAKATGLRGEKQPVDGWKCDIQQSRHREHNLLSIWEDKIRSHTKINSWWGLDLNVNS